MDSSRTNRSNVSWLPGINTMKLNGMSDMAGTAAMGSGRAERERARYNGADEISDGSRLCLVSPQSLSCVTGFLIRFFSEFNKQTAPAV
jgi:hypothetical protein